MLNRRQRLRSGRSLARTSPRQARLKQRKLRRWQLLHPTYGDRWIIYRADQPNRPQAHPPKHRARKPGTIRLGRIPDMPAGYCKSHRKYWEQGKEHAEEVLRLRGKIRIQSDVEASYSTSRGARASRENYFTAKGR